MQAIKRGKHYVLFRDGRSERNWVLGTRRFLFVITPTTAIEAIARSTDVGSLEQHLISACGGDRADHRIFDLAFAEIFAISAGLFRRTWVKMPWGKARRFALARRDRDIVARFYNAQPAGG